MLITVFSFKITQERSNALENPGGWKKTVPLLWILSNTFLQAGLTGLFGWWNTANLSRYRKINVSNLDLGLFHADTYLYNAWEAYWSKATDKKKRGSKTADTKKSHFLWPSSSVSNGRMFMYHKSSSNCSLFFKPAPEDNSLSNILRNGTENCTAVVGQYN